MSDEIADETCVEVTIAELDERVKKAPTVRLPAPPQEPSPAQKQSMRSAKRIVADQPPPTELRVGEDEWSRPLVGLPHTDEEGWWAQARLAFGTISPAFVEAEIGRLLKALQTRNSILPLEVEMNAALAVIEGMKPQNETEAMLAIQMALTHVVTVEMLSRMRNMDPRMEPEKVAVTTNAASKLMRGFAGHADVLHRMRRPPVQVVRVERVNVGEGGRAVVGVVSHPGEQLQSGDQPYGTKDQRAGEPAADAPLRGQAPGRLALPETQDAGLDSVPAPRWSTRKRRTER